jgi:BCCT family betaine/carnitine transporter
MRRCRSASSGAASTGLPFTLVLLGACWAILKGLLAEKRELA